MPNPVITIAMPFYNSAATLELSVRSLLNQSYDNFELLLCDDGSDDQGLAIARSFDDPRVICWSDGQRRRLAARLNECIDRARGQLPGQNGCRRYRLPGPAGASAGFPGNASPR